MVTSLFNNNQDIGDITLPGRIHFDPENDIYSVTGSGKNMWLTADAFHFAWTQVSGDVSLTANITFPEVGKNPHRKACLIIRQDLTAGSAYADAALHGDGLTSLQFRNEKDGTTHEVQANVSGPKRLRLEKRGAYVLMYLADTDQELQFSGASVRLELQEPFYFGIGVCSHEEDVVETALFSNVSIAPVSPISQTPTLYSVLETQDIASTDRRVCHVTTSHIEAPNWLLDGKTLLVNGNGRILQIPAEGGEPTVLDTGFAIRCNNDHGVSPDGTLLVVSDQSQENHQSLIYTLPITGGTPKRITERGPSYWHGWSPDGNTHVFCGQRDGKFGIFTIPAEGGEETRLTITDSLDDGPEYSPDGRYIYFNSDRTGRMQIWRMKPDGSALEQVTTDDYNNWFPHLSPSGEKMAFLSYEKEVSGHPPNKNVTLRLMNLLSGQITILGRFFGGQGTINVPCWSPDGRKIAFVTYQLIG